MKRDTNKRRARLGRGGFTLVELMIAVAIIAILAALLAPNMASYIRRSKGQGASNEVANVLRAARNQAMSRGEVIIATITTRDGATNSGGTIVLQRTDNDDPTNIDCDAVSDPSIDFDTTTDPDCFARSCAEAQAVSTKTPIFNYDISENHPDMIIQGLDPKQDDESLELCFSPSGRVLGSDGLPMQSDYGECDAVNARVFVRLDKAGVALGELDKNPIEPSKLLSPCIAVTDDSSESDRQTQINGRNAANFYSISIPFNGAISVRQ